MFIYRNGIFEKLDMNSCPTYDYLVDIRSNVERYLSHDKDWVHFPFRLIREKNNLPEHIRFNQKLYIFNGCPYGIFTRKAVDYLTDMGYINCYTMTTQQQTQ